MGDPGGHQPPVERSPAHGVVVRRQVGGGIGGRARAVDLGVRPQDPLAQPAGTAVDDEHEVAGGEPEPARVARLEDGLDPGQLDEVVAPADRAEALDVTGRECRRPRRPRPGRRRPLGVQRAVEVGEPGGELLGYGALELDREHGDAAADVGAHQERVQHGRRHGGADRGALAGVQVRHGGDVDHAVEGGHLVALRDGVGLDPAVSRTRTR